MYFTTVKLRYKTKTKMCMKLIFAGFVESVTSNIPAKIEYPILISMGVTGGQKIHVTIFLHPITSVLIKIGLSNLIGILLAT